MGLPIPTTPYFVPPSLLSPLFASPQCFCQVQHGTGGGVITHAHTNRVVLTVAAISAVLPFAQGGGRTGERTDQYVTQMIIKVEGDVFKKVKIEIYRLNIEVTDQPTVLERRRQFWPRVSKMTYGGQSVLQTFRHPKKNQTLNFRTLFREKVALTTGCSSVAKDCPNVQGMAKP
ncbi:hypothetical protein EGR_02010 [Echinococcus granulosus]|uniref:Uncharacterized protein n=1 Tax=Echinococcus granulosus TaxID=6210 RepID=W6UR98_ECHGR|nr:hypothetical protein EGR_02010 [Echinococcus granulosus]EUB63206.1 hypothetical protein EGR_02010 [Echinococcus granulosus]